MLIISLTLKQKEFKCIRSLFSSHPIPFLYEKFKILAFKLFKTIIKNIYLLKKAKVSICSHCSKCEHTQQEQSIQALLQHNVTCCI